MPEMIIWVKNEVLRADSYSEVKKAIMTPFDSLLSSQWVCNLTAILQHCLCTCLVAVIVNKKCCSCVYLMRWSVFGKIGYYWPLRIDITLRVMRVSQTNIITSVFRCLQTEISCNEDLDYFKAGVSFEFPLGQLLNIYSLIVYRQLYN